jgi:Ca2+-binding EF-hand superfamily protein
MCIKGVWKLEVPKERLVKLIELMDADEDGYVSFDEVRDLLKEYAQKIKKSMRYSKRK